MGLWKAYFFIKSYGAFLFNLIKKKSHNSCGFSRGNLYFNSNC